MRSQWRSWRFLLIERQSDRHDQPCPATRGLDRFMLQADANGRAPLESVGGGVD